ncbi:DUF2061 domain-containing protein [Aureibaculum sp. A20]|uniref:DUF2061 domain-containing protein n=1 Tax=Aureibaculum flavum TaxID=2795986 RepID=A0ABS0WS27_9FLAO|nr:DUF2061 domain-containing protein [Aureibaculum flavum]MBJ2174795.1 DUF2061 domain-containing protein [Aureibaculum flavum]
MIIDSLINSRVEAKEKTSGNKEHVKRSVAKTISWRIIGTIDTVIISWLITGTIALALSIGALEFISKMVLYFFHERAWNNIKWGK